MSEPGIRVIVLGAGIAGLTAADRAVRAGHDVTVIEATDRCGGAHRSVDIGPYTFDVGSIFYEENARLFEFAPGLEELCPVVHRIQRRIDQAGALRHYPLDPRDLLSWPKGELVAAVSDMVWSRLRNRRDGTLATICKTRLGNRLFVGTGLSDYITRFHHVPPSAIDEGFFTHRMQFIERATRTGAMMKSGWRAMGRRPFQNGRPARLRVRPEAGFDLLFERVRAELEGRNVRFKLSEAVEVIRREGPAYRVTTNTGRAYCGDVVVSTVPLSLVYGALFGADPGLDSLELLTLFVSAGRLSGEAGNVLYNFSPRGRWKRATVYSRLYPGRGAAREHMAVEVTLPPRTAPDPEDAFEDFRAHLSELEIGEDFQLEGHAVVPNAYPIYAPGRQGALDAALARVKAEGIVAAGRQGRFEYLPTSTGVIGRVVEELQAAGLAANRPSCGAECEEPCSCPRS